ncbi:LLM class F420-dependent oxidoreductase [Candidatus Entotheonella serta]|nr:LLM class F420-dependent oxidoreductase [Candidatus Entotheonella serta]
MLLGGRDNRSPPLVSGRGTLALAQRAEALGYDAVWVSDHIVYPATFAERFGTAVYEAITTLTWVGAVTERIRLGTAVLILIAPYRNPLLLAKQLSTLDDLSGGRTVVGVGAGWMEEEFAALGTPFAERGAITDEHLQVMRTLWRDTQPAHAGERYQFPPLCADPRPAQQPAPPIWIGGNSRPALRRDARLGEGWLPIWHAPTGRGFSPTDLRVEIERLAELTEHAGRSVTQRIGGLMPLALSHEAIAPDPLAPLVGRPDQVVEILTAFKDAGLHHVILSPFYGVSPDRQPADLDAVERLLERFMHEVVTSLATSAR